MPWKIIPPREGKTKNYYVRGKYLGIALDDSTGTSELRAAKRILATWKRQAERGEFSRRAAPAVAAPATFLSAAVAYMQADGERRYVEPILNVWGEKPLAEIDQIAIDTLASTIYPKGSAATRNRQVYTPISAILKRAGIENKVKRPKGWRGKKSTSWLEPAQAFALFDAADAIDAEFGLLCRFLLYTGMRLNEGLGVEVRHLHLERGFVYLPDSKNGEPRGCHLPAFLIDEFKAQPPRIARKDGKPQTDAGMKFLERPAEAKLFRFHKGGALYDMLKEAMKAARLVFPVRQRGFHLFCHTYGSWMHRFGNLDTHGLTRTGRWADADSADRYVHTGAAEEAQRSDLLPTPKRGEVVEIKKVAS